MTPSAAQDLVIGIQDRVSPFVRRAPMKYLPSQEHLSALLDYDPATGELRWKLRGAPRFDSRFGGRRAFTARSPRGYAIGRILGVTYFAHRVIWKMVHGFEPEVIDHIDRDSTNNRLDNLRNGSQRDNLANRGPYRTYAGKPHSPMSQTERSRRNYLRRKSAKVAGQ